MNKEVYKLWSKDSMDDILFERRNKAYGAYQLRKLYDKHMTRGLWLGTFLFLLVVSMPIIIRYLQGVLPEKVEKLQIQEVRLAEIPPIDPKKTLPPPPKVITQQLNDKVRLIEPEVKKDAEVEEVQTTPDPVADKKETVDTALSNHTIATVPSPADGDGTVGQNEATGTSEGSDNGTIYSVVEEAPRFPGCEHLALTQDRKKCAAEKMLQYLYKNIKYPDMAKLKGIEGKCILTFVVEKDGSITSASIAQDIGAGCGQEALRVIESMNNLTERWRPGMQRGTPVRFQYSLPLTFKLSRVGL